MSTDEKIKSFLKCVLGQIEISTAYVTILVIYPTAELWLNLIEFYYCRLAVSEENAEYFSYNIKLSYKGGAGTMGFQSPV
jgi:hypothetical protein